jgi:hypothetical protein
MLETLESISNYRGEKFQNLGPYLTDPLKINTHCCVHLTGRRDYVRGRLTLNGTEFIYVVISSKNPLESIGLFHIEKDSGGDCLGYIPLSQFKQTAQKEIMQKILGSEAFAKFKTDTQSILEFLATLEVSTK